ncbi:MAG: right-handed parallel beta-helix repeat-containing protein [Planctomycetota bacterium]
MTFLVSALALLLPLLAPQAAQAPAPALRLHVAAGAGDDGAGTRADPLGLRAALARAAEASTQRAVEVLLAGGRYPIDAPLMLGPELRGTAARPIVVRAAPGAEVVFDGALALDPARFAPVGDAAERGRLARSAADAIVVQEIDDPALRARLEAELVLSLVVDGVAYLPARYPNDGYAHLAPEALEPEVSPPAVPVGEEDYGVRAGHGPYREPEAPEGWLGAVDRPRGARAGLAPDTPPRAGTWEQWEAEITRDPQRSLLTGFLDANWLQRSQHLVAADAEERSLHLSEALAYGWAWRDEKPFWVFGLLCELDAPGEWHYDRATARLYLYPPVPLGEGTRVSLPVADGFLRFAGAQHVTVADVVVEHVASGDLVRFESGGGNTLSGATLRNSTACGVRLLGAGDRVLGCDLVDLDRHVVLAGGRRGPGLLEAGGNAVENCHIFQRRFGHRRVGVSISGVGNAFRNNLVHNSLGQAVTVRGNDHRIERNELFNIGYDEGDGGAIYAGGDLTGYGVVYRHNFFHHLMHVPGKVERSGIHLDDLQAGATCEGNVFYKSAGKGVFMNGGAGHRVVDNVFVRGFRGAYNVGHGARSVYERQLAIAADPAHPYRGKKEDYVGRAEQVVGPGGWKAEPWASRYPLFGAVMEDAGAFGRLWPVRCEVRGNVYCGNAQGDHTIWSRVAPEARAKSALEPDRAVDASVFADLDALDLSFRDGLDGLPAIPFGQIGLYLDEHRARMPQKASYRTGVRAFFEGVPCMPGTTRRIDSAALVDAAPVVTR